MQTRSALLALAIIAGLLLTACTPPASGSPAPNPSPTPAPAASLEGTTWTLATLNGQPPLAGTIVTLLFEGGKAGGSDGCNRYSAAYTSGGGKLAVDKNVISTKMACAGPVMQQAQNYIAALTGAAAYQSDGKGLTLLDGSGKALATFAAQSQSLAGTSWVATGVNNGQQAVVSVIGGTKLTLEFKPDGKVSGNGGCNGFGGTYTVTGKELKISGLVQTLMACSSPAGVMDQERLYTRALESAAGYTIEGDKLTIRGAGGATAATFDKAK